MRGITDVAGEGRGRRLAWFVGLYLASVVALAAVAGVIKLWIGH